MKPEFTKPFNLEHAKAGAPFACRNGDQVEIFKWDARYRHGPIIGVLSAGDVPSSWAEDGRYDEAHGGKYDLIMLPLGIIDGKPVFVGDEFLYFCEPATAKPDMACADFSNCRWPAPEKNYPTYNGDLEILHGALNGIECHGGTISDGLQVVADTALRHAIESGQVAPISEAKPGIRPHNPYTGALRDQRDIESDPMGKLIRHPDEPLRSAEDDAIRNIKVIIHDLQRAFSNQFPPR